jgi:hypothetical protein
VKLTKVTFHAGGESTPSSSDALPTVDESGGVVPHSGTAFVYTLSEPSRVTIKLELLRAADQPQPPVTQPAPDSPGSQPAAGPPAKTQAPAKTQLLGTRTIGECRVRPSLGGCGIRVGGTCRVATRAAFRALLDRIARLPAIRHLRGTARARAVARAVRDRRCVLRARTHGATAAPLGGSRRVGLGLIATLTRDLPPGPNGTTLSGVVDGHALPVGDYQATLTATDSAGDQSAPVTLNFSIIAASTPIAGDDGSACGSVFSSGSHFTAQSLDCAVFADVALPSCKGIVSLSERATGALIRILDFAEDPYPDKCNPIQAIAISPDKTTVAVIFHGSDFGSNIQLIALADQPQSIRILSIDSYFHGLAFSADGRQLIASASTDAPDRAYAVADARPLLVGY